MSWRDATMADEPAEDRALRAELQKMLGLPQAQPQHPELDLSPDAPDTIALAQTLHREAMRRRRTYLAAKPAVGRPFLLLLAAATLPVLLTAGSLGAWGVKQKRQAAVLAAKVQELETQQNRIDASREGAKSREAIEAIEEATEAREAQQTPQASDSPPARTQNSNGELIKPEEQPRRLNTRPIEHRVNDSR